MPKILRKSAPGNDELRFVAFSEVYRLEEPKLQRKAFGLLEAAIKTYARKGFDGTTLEMIAREAGVTRPLLRHYFRNADEIREYSIKYIRVLFQKLALAWVGKARTPEEMLSNYVDSCFYWAEHFRDHSIVWFSFLHRCAGNSKWRQINTVAQKAGADRIAAIIELGIAEGQSAVNSADAAKTIQALIAGGLMISASESLESPDSFAIRIRRDCLLAAGFKADQGPATA